MTYSKNLSGKIAASDPEGGLYFSVNTEGDYGSLSIDSNSGSWKYTPEKYQIDKLGNENVYDTVGVQVNDGTHSEIVEWKIKIEGENDAPVIETYDIPLVGYVDFDISAYDVNADESIYAVTNDLSGYVYAYDPESYDDWTWSIEYHDISYNGGYQQFGDCGHHFLWKWRHMQVVVIISTAILMYLMVILFPNLLKCALTTVRIMALLLGK